MSPRPPIRRGACPALSRPMETGDGLLVRLVPEDGILAPAQLDGLAHAARAFGNGLLEVSARGSLQLRGLRPETVTPLNEAVAQLAIVPRMGIPMDLSPLSGSDPTELADARALAARLKERLAEAGIQARLGPKVSVVLDGGGAVRLDALSADVRLHARPAAEGVMWELALAGDAAHARPVALLKEEEALDAAFAWLARVAALGPSARMDDALAGDGAASGPFGGPAAARATPAVAQTAAQAASEAASEAGRRLSPRPGAHGGGTTGEASRGPGCAFPPAPIGRIPLRDGRLAQGIGVPFGQVEAATLHALVAAAIDAGARDLRTAPGRTLLACGLTEDGAARLAEAAEALGFLTRPDDPRALLSACPGAPACRSAHMPARAAADAMADALAPLLDGSITVHLSACAKGCAHPAPASLTLVGMDGGIGLVREGTAGAAPEAMIAADDLLAALRLLADAVTADRRPGESARDALARRAAARAGAPEPGWKTLLEPYAS